MRNEQNSSHLSAFFLYMYVGYSIRITTAVSAPPRRLRALLRLRKKGDSKGQLHCIVFSVKPLLCDYIGTILL